MFFPVGNDNETVWRTPWVTFGIIALNVAIFAITYPIAVRQENYAVARAEQVHTYLRSHPELMDNDRLDELHDAGLISDIEVTYYKKILDTMRTADTRDSRSVVAAEELDQYHQLLRNFTKARDESIVKTLGYTPHNGHIWAVLTSMFVHGGIWHLVGNMLFFFAIGFTLEDLWGRAFFATFYVVSGIVAVMVHVAMFPTSTAPLIGASGAIAGVMGAFLVRQFRTRIKFLYLRLSFTALLTQRIAGSFMLPAYVFMPFWFAEQFLLTYISDGSRGGVAYWAHIGGFGFGMVFAAGLKLSKLEERYLKPAIDAKVDFGSGRTVTEALELIDQNDLAKAEFRLNLYLESNPTDINALFALARVYERAENHEKLRSTYVRLIHQYIRTKDSESALITYDSLLNTYTEAEPILSLDMRDWIAICEYLCTAQMYQEAAVEYRRAGRTMKSSPSAPKALILSGETFLEHVNNPREAINSFNEALALSPAQPAWITRINVGLEKAKEALLPGHGASNPATQAGASPDGRQANPSAPVHHS